MICKNCGFTNPDDSVFCAKCGGETTSKVEITEENKAVEEKSVEAPMPIIGEADTATPIEEKGTKKRKKGKKIAIILGSIASVLAVGALVVWLMFDTILYNFFPDLYTANVIKNTINMVGDETNQAVENITGISPDAKEMTSAVDLTIVNPDLWVPDITVSMAVSASEKENEIRMRSDVGIGNGEMELFELLWNNKDIKFTSPEVMDEALSVPSKDFGKKFTENEYLMSLVPEGIEIDENTDLSVSELFKNKGSIDKKADEKFVDEIVDFFCDCEVKNKGTAKITLDGKETKVNKWDFVVTSESVKELLTNLLQIAEESEGYSQYFEIYGINSETLKANLESIEFEDVTLTFYAYKNVVVKVEASEKTENNEWSFSFGFTSWKNKLDNMELSFSDKSGTDENSLVITIEGNLTSGEEKCEDVLTINVTNNGVENEPLVLSASVDFEDEKYVLTAKSGDSQRSFEGEISRNDEEFSIGAEIDNTDGSVSGGMAVNVTLSEGVNVEVDNIDEAQDLTDMTKEDIEELLADISGNIESALQSFVTEAMFGGLLN